MKCLKNTKTGTIIRVDDKQAYNMAGNQWSYVSKDEWRKYKSSDDDVVVSHDLGGPIMGKKEKDITTKRKKTSIKENE